jgi:phosphoribosylformylglycinamidine synthase
MHYHVHVAIERKEAILDPQGKATHHALDSLGLKKITDTRIGKFVRLAVEAGSPDEANALAREASEKLLANPIMETYRIVDTKAV